MLQTLTADEKLRYSRQLGPAVLSEESQRRLKGSAALVTRVGGVGGPAALALVMAGIGRLIIAHAGELESPDLNRQLLGSEQGIAQARVSQFAASLRRMNSAVQVDAIDHEPDDDESLNLAGQVNIVLSCAADFAQRLRLNRAACHSQIPFLDAAQWGMAGSLLVSNPQTTACLTCLYPDLPPFETDFPVVGAIAGLMGNFAALEAIKILTGTGKPMWGQLQIVDGYEGTTRTLQLKKRDDCPVCRGPYTHLGGPNRDDYSDIERTPLQSATCPPR